jgi:hypothetical protein
MIGISLTALRFLRTMHPSCGLSGIEMRVAVAHTAETGNGLTVPHLRICIRGVASKYSARRDILSEGPCVFGG